MIKLSLIMLVVALPISFAASLCQFCLEPQGIVYQTTPWSGFREHGWDDVSSVTTTCRYRSGPRAGWTKQFIVAMRDGAAIDLMTWPAAALRAYPAIAQALHGHEFAFDASGVSPRCPEPYLDMLTRRP